MKRLLILIAFVSITLSSFAQETSSLTKPLMQQWVKAWNNKDANALKSMLQKNVIFESPYNIRISRDSIAATIFKRVLPKLGNLKTAELHSLVNGSIAWSIGKATGMWSNNKPWEATYTFEFIKKANLGWKIQMLIFYEK